MTKFLSLIVLMLSLTGQAQVTGTDQASCNALNSAEGTLAKTALSNVDSSSCKVDSDCVLEWNEVYFVCGGFVNTYGKEVLDSFMNGIVFTTLEAKFKDLGCIRIPPPCPFPGNAVCNQGKCTGRLPH